MSRNNTAYNFATSINTLRSANENKRMREVLEAQAAAQGIETPSMARDRARRARGTQRDRNIARHNAKLAAKGLTPCPACSTCIDGGGSTRRGILMVLALFTCGLSLLVLPFESKCQTCGCHTSFGNHH